MMRCAWILRRAAGVALVLAAPPLALAQQAGALTDTQKLGERLFVQSCEVCHLKPTLTSARFGPALYKDLIAGQEAAMHEFIKNGTTRMPGFQYELTPAEIDAVVQYLETLPKPPDEAGPAKKSGQVD